RREHCPHQDAALRVADVNAELRDCPVIMLGATRPGRKRATQRLRRAEDEAPAAGDVATEGSDPDTGLCLRRRAVRQDPCGDPERADRQAWFPEHSIELHFAETSRNTRFCRLPHQLAPHRDASAPPTSAYGGVGSQ